MKDDDILSIDHLDDNNDYDGFYKHLNDNIKRNKLRTASEIDELGNTFLSEIELKNKSRIKAKNKYISYILKNNDSYDKSTLEKIDYDDLRTMCNEIKSKKKDKIKKLFNFFGSEQI